MKYFLTLSLATLIFVTESFCQSDTTNTTAKVYIIRATGLSGALVNLRVVINDSMHCKISNNHYSETELNPGKYTFYVTSWDAPKKREKLGLEISIEAGKTYYLRIILKQRFFETQMFIEEITQNSAKPLLSRYKKDNNCTH